MGGGAGSGWLATQEGQPGCLLGSLHTHPPPHSALLSSLSDYVIDDKVAILQKRDHEGFGFVLRGAKGNGVWVS